MIKISDLSTFEAVNYLDSEEAIAQYLSTVMQLPDGAMVSSALNDAAKAIGIIQLAKDTGIHRAILCEALCVDTSPRYDMIVQIIQALGFKLTVIPET